MTLLLLFTGVGDAGLQQLSSLASLTSLNLDSRLFTDLGMRHIKGLTNLVAPGPVCSQDF